MDYLLAEKQSTIVSITDSSLVVGSFVSRSLTASRHICVLRCWRLNMFMIVLNDLNTELMGC